VTYGVINEQTFVLQGLSAAAAASCTFDWLRAGRLTRQFSAIPQLACSSNQSAAGVLVQ
jgi:hypothetical protein